jgi:acyl-CoA thioesterase FadM
MLGAMPWIETYRGTVHRWEADNVEHFTVAYYFARFEDATLGLVEALGLGSESLGGGRTVAIASCRVRYLKELRVGDLLHIRSGAIGVADGDLALGHQVFDSGDGRLCTTVEQRAVILDADRRAPTPLSRAEQDRILGARVEWDGGPPSTAAPEPPADDTRFVDAARDTIKPWEVDGQGFAAPPAFIHRFTAANGHVLGSFGMTPEYMRRERRGFSTFELNLAFPGTLRAGALVHVRSGLVHVGKSSIRILHRMTDTRTGALVATLDQAGVSLDLAARRPAPLPDDLHERAMAMLLGRETDGQRSAAERP